MTPLVFGVTDSPRLARVKRKFARMERARERLAHPERVPVPRLVCPDGGGRCSSKCELIDDCPGPVPNPAREGTPTP